VRSRRKAKGDESLTRQSDDKCSVKWVIVLLARDSLRDGLTDQETIF